MCPAPVTLTFDLLTLKMVSESRVTWATSVPVLVIIGLSVLDLGPMYATDRQSDVRQHHRLMSPPRGRYLQIKYKRMMLYIRTCLSFLPCSIHSLWQLGVISHDRPNDQSHDGLLADL